MIDTTDLRVEYRTNPINVYEEKPRFSWKIHTDKTNVLQTAYVIEVSEDENFSSVIWNSGKVNSDESHLVCYEGQTLVSSSRYFWRVKIWDNQHEESSWSETSFFETTIFSNDEWEAVFITAENSDAGESSAGTLLRKEFNVERNIKRAHLYASAKGLFISYINGKKTGSDILSPGWTEYASRLLFQTYDVTSLIQTGSNAIGFMVGPGWYKGDLASWLGKRNIYGKRTAIIAQLRIEYEDGKIEIIKSDDSWKCDNAPVTYAEIYHGEKYDARLEQKGWNASGFHDADWKSVEVESSDLTILKPHDGVPVTEHETFKPLSLIKTPEGDSVINFGQNISGLVRFTVKGKAGDKVTLRHAEVLDSKGNFYTENLRRAKQKIEYILGSDEPETYSAHFTFFGFQYIAIDEWPGEINIDDFEAHAIYSDIKPSGEFACSYPLLNQFVNNVRWSMKDNFVDIPTDCPQRDERLGWTGDAHVFLRSANYLMETAPFMKKWLRDLAASQLEDGQVSHVVPNVLWDIGEIDDLITGNSGATGWADAATGMPWMIYTSYGDKDILEEQYPSMKKWVDYMHRVSENGTLFNTGFHFGDWVALDAKEGSYYGATPNDLCATAYYAYSCNILAKTAALLHKKNDAEKYSVLYGEIVQAYQKEFFTPNGRLAARTQTAHILSLAFNLTPTEYKKRTINTLVELVAEQNNHLTTGFLGTPYVCHALSENGHADLAYELLLKEDFPSWLYQVTKGATTIWEHWDGMKPDGTMWSANMNSFNHYAYGAVCDWVFSNLGGLNIDPEKPAYKCVVLKPIIPAAKELSWAETKYESVYGTIKLRWEKKDGKIHVDVSIPPNSTAMLAIPGTEKKEFGSGEHSFIF
jgi:alpha-L-rhamnosidase